MEKFLNHMIPHPYKLPSMKSTMKDVDQALRERRLGS